MSKPFSGLTVVRDAIRGRKGSNARLARDVGISSMRLDTFVEGGDLPLDKINLLVEDIWHGFVEYSPEADALKPREQAPARSIGIPPTLNIDLPKFTPGPPPRGPQPVVAAPKPKQRPGWIGGVWE
jgi:hypothetical protein